MAGRLGQEWYAMVAKGTTCAWDGRYVLRLYVSVTEDDAGGATAARISSSFTSIPVNCDAAFSTNFVSVTRFDILTILILGISGNFLPHFTQP